MEFNRIKEKEFTGQRLDCSDLWCSPNVPLVGVNLDDAYLSHANLAGVDMSKASLGRVRAHQAFFTNTKLSYAGIHHSAFSWCNFDGAHLEGIDVHSTDLSGASFLVTDFTDARIYNVVMAEVHLGTTTIFTGAQISLVSLSGWYHYGEGRTVSIPHSNTHNSHGIIPPPLKEFVGQWDYFYFC